MFQVMTGIMGPFIGLSIHGAIGRQYVEKDSRELAEYIGNCLILTTSSFCVASLVFFLFGNLIADISSIDKNWLWTIIVFVFGQALIQVLLVLWQMQGKAKQYAFLSFAQTVFNALLSLYAIVQLGMGWKGRLEAQAMTTILFAVLAVVILFRQNWINPKYNKAYIFSALSFGLPLIPHALSGWAMSMIDRVFVTNIVGIADTGVYSVGYQIGMVIGILEASFIQAWVPHFYRQLKKDTFVIKLKLVRFTYIYCFGLLILAFLLAFIAKYFLPYFVGDKFIAADQYILWIALGYSFNGMYKMMAGYFFYFEKTYVLAKITTVAAIINVVLTYFFVTYCGTVGAAYSTTLCYFITFLLTWSMVNKIYKMPWFTGSRKQ